MILSAPVLNERDAKKARAAIARARVAQAADALLRAAQAGLSHKVVEAHRKALSTFESALGRAVEDYEQAKAGSWAAFQDRVRTDPGLALVVARIARGMSQAGLAERLGMREQQVQRYEADRYRSISLGNYRRIAAILGVQLEASVRDREPVDWLGSTSREQIQGPQADKVAAHAVANGWVAPSTVNPIEAVLELIDDADENNVRAALLRTGLGTASWGDDLALAAWRARVASVARSTPIDADFDPFDVSWIAELVRLSVLPDGPAKALDLVRSRGIKIVIERQLPGLKLDGAAFVVDGVPVVALTLRYDRIDYFWYTLLHELGHVFLHHQCGLASGFVDNLDEGDLDEVESEANDFAASALVPPEAWRLSPARIAKSEAPIEQLAKSLGIHPAIIFGKIRHERSDYSLFSKRLGSGEVRKLFL